MDNFFAQFDSDPSTTATAAPASEDNFFAQFHDDGTANDNFFAQFHDQAPADISKIAGDPVNQPSQFSSGVGANVPIADNPDFAMTKYAVNNPGQFVKQVALDTPAAALGLAGNVVRSAADDLVSVASGDPSFGGNLKALGQGAPYNGDPLPADKLIASASATNPKLATATDVGQGIAASAPALLAGGAPAVLQKAAALGFSADMISKVGQLATDYGAEVGKNKEDQDPAKLAKLQSELIQTGIFAPLAAAHGAGDFVSSKVEPANLASREAAKIIDETPVQPKPGAPATPVTRPIEATPAPDGSVMPDKGAEILNKAGEKPPAPVEPPKAQATTIPPPEGNRVVTVQKPDGSTYQAAFGDKFWNLPQRGDVPSIATEKNGAWSHGILPEGDKIVNDTKSPELVGMGAATPKEFEPVKEFTASNKNEQVDQDSVARGQPPLMKIARQGVGKVWDDAMSKIDEDAGITDRLVKEIDETGKASSHYDLDTQNALLLHKRIELHNTLNKSLADLNQHIADDYQPGIEEARLRAAQASDDLQKLDSVTRTIGTQLGRGLNARKMMAREDYSLAAMTTKLRAANGGHELAPEDEALINDLNDKITKQRDAYEKHIADLEKQLSEAQSKTGTGDLVKEVEQEDKQAKAKTPGTKTPRDPAAERDALTEGLKAKVDEGTPKQDLGNWIQRIAKTFVREGERDAEKLTDKVHNIVKTVAPDFSRTDTMNAISGYGDFRQLSKDEVSVELRRMKGELQQVGKIEDMQKGQAPLKTGVERRQPSQKERNLIKQVNEMKRKLGLTITDPAKQLQSALGAIKTRLKNQIDDLDLQIASGTKTVKTKTPVPLDKEATDLKARRDELKKQFDDIFGKPELTDEQRIKLANAAVDRQISEIQDQIKNGHIFPGSKGPKLTTPELEAKRADLDALKEQREYMRAAAQPKPEKDKEAIALKGAKARLKNQIEDLNLQIASGKKTVKTKTSTTLDQEATDLQTKRDELKKQFDDIFGKPELTDAQRIKLAEAAVDRQIDDVQNQIKTGYIFPETKGAKLTSPELEAKRAALDALKEQRQYMRDAAQPKPEKSKEQIALQGAKARLKTRIAELEDKLAKQDFSKKLRTPVKFDEEGNKLRAAYEATKLKFDQEVARKRLADRTEFEKAFDGIAKWRRAFVLTYPTILGKLTSASAELIGITPIEEGIGKGISKILPKVAEKAPRYGQGFQLKAETDAMVHTWKTLFSAVGQKLKTGQSDIDLLYGDPKIVPPELKDYIQNIHSALKEPARQNEFIRSFQKRAEHYAAAGVDTTDPLVQTKIGLEAYKDANAKIFMEKNTLADGISRFMTAFDAKDPKTGKVNVSKKLAATAVKYELPIVKIPLNIVKRAFEYSFGTVVGGFRLGRALSAGLDKLEPEEADIIMRNLQRGLLGVAVLALGYFNPKSVGGYYQKGEKRDPKDVKYGGVKIFGHEIPRIFVHNPLLEQLQIGATIRRIVDFKLHKSDKEGPGYLNGILGAYGGLAEELPFTQQAEQTLKLLDPQERPKFLGELLKSTVPGVAQWAAGQLDQRDLTPGKFITGTPIPRNPKTPAQYLETAIPGLRQNVPKK
jgi:hypothetical protein